MISKENIAETREELMARGEQLRRRAEDMRERIAEKVEHIDREAVIETTGRTLVSAGLSLGIAQWFRGRRDLSAMILPLALLVTGMTLMGRGISQRRGWQLDKATEGMRRQLSAIHPVSRFQVLHGRRHGTISFVGRSHN